MLKTIKNPLLLRKEIFVAGQWRTAAGGGSYAVYDPATGASIATVPDCGPADAESATDAAHEAAPGWRAHSARARAQLLKQWHRLMLENCDDLATIMSAEQGKPLAEARGEVAYGASYVEWFAEEAVRANGDIAPQLIQGTKQMVVKEPIGIVAAITPWNFPLAMIARKIAPALAAGCTVVAKPAEDTPLTALAMVRLIEEAGFPPGVVNIVTASRGNTPGTVKAWLDDARVRKITFTGSTIVGKYLAAESAQTLKKLTLELGGNAPFIVFDDADLGAALDGLMAAKFRNGGQTCVSPNRVYVHESVYEEFTRRVTERVAALRVGPASHEASEIGPMINERAVEKIDRHVKDALRLGANLMTGGERLRNDVADGPFYFQPTVLSNASDDMLLANEETFGPVIALFPFRDEDDVIWQANNTPYGLSAYFYSNNSKRIWRVAAALEAGVVGINRGAVASEALPFGGIKESGYGREGSSYGLDEYMHTKYLCQGELD